MTGAANYADRDLLIVTGAGQPNYMVMRLGERRCGGFRAMHEASVTLIPATVMAQLSHIGITFVVWPGRMEYVGSNCQGVEATQTLPIDVVPTELRAPNTPVWIVTKRYGAFSKDARFETEVLARHGNAYPDQYKHMS